MSDGGPSFWLGTTPETDYGALTDGLDVDVAVVGAGITGITAAVLLQRSGKTVAFLDSKWIVHGARPVPGVPAPVLPRPLEPRRAKLGLPVPRLPLCSRWAGHRGPDNERPKRPEL